MKYTEMKLIVTVVSLRLFLQKKKIVSGNKCYVNTTSKRNHPKWNICTCHYFTKTKTEYQKIKTKMSFISFLPQRKLMYFFMTTNRIFSWWNEISFWVSWKHPLGFRKFNSNRRSPALPKIIYISVIRKIFIATWVLRVHRTVREGRGPSSILWLHKNEVFRLGFF